MLDLFLTVKIIKVYDKNSILEGIFQGCQFFVWHANLIKYIFFFISASLLKIIHSLLLYLGRKIIFQYIKDILFKITWCHIFSRNEKCDVIENTFNKSWYGNFHPTLWKRLMRIYCDLHSIILACELVIVKKSCNIFFVNCASFLIPNIFLIVMC